MSSRCITALLLSLIFTQFAVISANPVQTPNISINIEIFTKETRIMDLETCAKALKELGHPSRLGIYKRLVRSGRNGLPVGALQKELDIPGSTLSHHIAALVSVGLVQQNRDGRILNCVARFDTFNEVMEFLNEACCVDESA